MPILKRAPRPGAAYLAGAPLLIAHRGGAGLAPENTIVAFRQAVDWWASDILELDVQLTSDGEVVVLHDERVDRTTDGRGATVDLSLRQIQELDAGYRYDPNGDAGRPYRGCGVRIPTLDEVLRAFPAHRINVEVKDARAGARVREVITGADAEPRVLVAAGSRQARLAVGRYAGATSAAEAELRRFYLLHRARMARLYRPEVDALQLPHFHDGREIPSPRLVRDAHRHNLPIHVWTVDAPDHMRRLLEWGVDGIVTDRPDRLARVLHELRGRPRPPGPPPEAKSGFLERLLLA